MRARHGAHYVALLSKSAEALHGRGQYEWIVTVRRSMDDIHAATSWAIDTGRRNDAVTLTAGLGWFWWVDGGISEGLDTLERALDVPGEVDPAVHVLGLVWSAYLATHAGHGELSTRRAEEAIAVAHQHGDPLVTGQALMVLGYRFGFLGHSPQARAMLEEADLYFEQCNDDPWARAAQAFVRASARRAAGERAEAEEMSSDAAQRFETIGDEFFGALAHRIAADLAEDRHDHDGAVAHLGAALATARRYEFHALASMIGNRWATASLDRGDVEGARAMLADAERHGIQLGHAALLAWARNLTAVLLRQEGRLAEAEAAATSSLSYYRAASASSGLILSLRTLGFIAEQLGDAATATALHTEALAEARRVGDHRAIAGALVGLAGAAVVSGEHHTARQLLGEAAELWSAVAGPPTAVERFDLDRVSAAVAVERR